MCHLLPVPQMCSQFWYAEVDSGYSLPNCCKTFLSCCCSGVVSDVEVCKTDARKAMEVVCKFVCFEVIISTCISILTEAVVWRFSVKKMFLEIVQISQENKIIPWLTLHTWKTVCVSWLTNFSKGVCVFLSLG